MTRAPWAVVLDFDGTITKDDVADSILNEFGGLSRRMINASYDPSVVTEEWVRSMFLRVKETPSRLRRFVRETAQAREGFHEFVGRCRELGIAVEVVSGGLDLYLDLKKEPFKRKITKLIDLTRHWHDSCEISIVVVQWRYLKVTNNIESPP